MVPTSTTNTGQGARCSTKTLTEPSVSLRVRQIVNTRNWRFRTSPRCAAAGSIRRTAAAGR